MSGIYIHIPFCQSRCIYCDFYSTLYLDKRETYVEQLIQEMHSRKEELPESSRTYHTIYIGGGTPSTLSPKTLQHLLQSTTDIFPISNDAEITIEANPDDVTTEWVRKLKDTPVNRISMGIQTFDDNLLKFLNRRHNSQQALDAVKHLQEAGYNNISIDLIYGIPGQDEKRWKEDVEKAITLNIPHLSAYSLMYEEGTQLTTLKEKGKIDEVNEETSLWCYDYLCKRLSEEQYEHYEISNFARQDYHSKHNSGYWEGIPYLGFGAGAHSYDGARIRRWNEGNVLAYSENGPSYETEELTDVDLYNEYIMTRLRTRKGISLQELHDKFGKKAYDYCLKQSKSHLQQGNLRQMGHILSLTHRGIFISNQVMSDLFR